MTAIWTGLRDGVARPWGDELERILLGGGEVSRPPRVAARALTVLAEIGLVEVGEAGVRAVPDPPRRELDGSARYRSCQVRLEASRAYLALAPTLDIASVGHERAAALAV